MTDLFNYFASNDGLIIICLMIIIIILIGIIMIIDLNNRRKRTLEQKSFEQENIDELNNEINSNINDDIIEVKEIKYVESNEELEKTKAKLELETLKAELAKAEEQNKRQNESIDNQISDPITTFEDEQEQKAIISVEELSKKADQLYDQNEITQYQDEGNEPISIQELEALYQESKQTPAKEIINDSVNATVNMTETFSLNNDDRVKSTKFTSTPFISPVYGMSEVEDKEQSLDNINLEQTANLEKLNEELRKVNEFLVALKELRNKLQ